METSTFGRKRDKRHMLLRNLATAIILYESVTTTEAKGRTVQPILDRLISIGLTDDPITARRKLLAYLTDENAVKKILNELKERYHGYTSGFTRRLVMPPRKGDGAPQVMIQLTRTVFIQESPREDTKTSASKSQPEATSSEKSNETQA